MSISIHVSSAIVKALHARGQQAYLKDDGRLVGRTTVLIDLLVHHVPMAVLCERWGRSSSWRYDWQRPGCCTAWALAPRHGDDVHRSPTPHAGSA